MRLPKLEKCPRNLVESRKTKVCTEGKSILDKKSNGNYFAMTQYPRPSKEPQQTSGFFIININQAFSNVFLKFVANVEVTNLLSRLNKRNIYISSKTENPFQSDDYRLCLDWTS